MVAVDVRSRPGGHAGRDVDARDVDVAANGGGRRTGLVGVRVEEEERAPAGGEGLKAVAAKEVAPRDGGNDVAARKVRVEPDDNRRDPVGDGRLDDGAVVRPEDEERGQPACDRLEDAVEERRPVGEAGARCRARAALAAASAP